MPVPVRSKRAVSASISVWARIAALRINDTDLLAPKVQLAVAAAIDELRFTAANLAYGGQCIPLDAIVFETLRTDELQAIYYEQGTTRAKTARKSWHFYGLAVDVISARYEWFGNAAAIGRWSSTTTRAAVARHWFAAVADVMKRHDMKWGGDWSDPDLPHLQWGRCAKTPNAAPRIYDAAGGGQAGREAVWRAVGAE
jgi:peptidoglycan LD-endopeptidase CwlK